MHSYGSAFYELKNKLQPLYDEREAAAMAHEILHFITGLDKTQRLLKKETVFNDRQQQQYDQATLELLKGRPLQYVTGSAWFRGKEYQVNEHVLIPRPETEELVEWIVTQISNSKFPIPKILDIGTGSGCIPISLKLELPGPDVTSSDISSDALSVAAENAKRLHADVHFLQLDFLDASQHNKLAVYDVIVSNPPYIPEADKDSMHKNVKDHEPGIALFVPDNDALVFYRAIAAFGKAHLSSNGYIYCELDAGHALECKQLFKEAGYKDVEVRKDMHGNLRMLRAGK
jgi:release factor glutamine methyltransferase